MRGREIKMEQSKIQESGKNFNTLGMASEIRWKKALRVPALPTWSRELPVGISTFELLMLEKPNMVSRTVSIEAK